MSTGENKRSVQVGIFVFLGIVIFVVGVLFLGGQQKRFIKSIEVSAVFDDVGGLKTGNNVWFSGVKVGTVKQVHFYGKSQVEVTMNIEKEAQQYIHKDARAAISSEGFIGNKIVVIEGGSPQLAMVDDGDIIQAKTVLGTDQIMETLQENNKNLLKITTDFKGLVSKIARGKGTVGAVLTDSLLAEQFRSTINNLERASANANRMSGSLSNYAAKLNTKGSLAHELVTDTSVYANIKTSVRQLQQATSSAKEIADRASVATNNVVSASNQLKSTDNTLGLLLNDKNTSNDVKSLLKNLESSSRKLDQNMEALKHNFLFRGYFRREEKKAAKAAKDSLKNAQP
ncbi:MlaD family protein [Siphonobacter curvatus]|uniref:MCE family protein n=1 Tax=Siphonobacter curvatus TaxID=2094562 RepID=A0A2S7ILU8_9BACT|nr:MlaD family protein [Siphonobacter curvatus]PQA58692.1 MCE family protein [Siphonobacter curvatus]